jgi:hypothetical protein
MMNQVIARDGANCARSVACYGTIEAGTKVRFFGSSSPASDDSRSMFTELGGKPLPACSAGVVDLSVLANVGCFLN